MGALWFLLVASMLITTLAFELLDNYDNNSPEVDNGEVPSTSQILSMYRYDHLEPHGSRFARAAATKTTKKAPAKSSSKGSSKGKTSKKFKLNRLNQKYWADMLNCCDVPEFLTKQSRQTCYPKFKDFKGQFVFVPPSLPNVEPFNRTCLIECAFKKETLIDATTKLISIPSLDAKIKQMAALNPKWSNAITSAYDTCNSQYTSLINPDNPCKTGAAEYSQCLMKYLVANCPEEVQKKKVAGCFEKLTALRSLLNVKIKVAATTKAGSATTAAAVASETAASDTTVATTAAP